MEPKISEKGAFLVQELYSSAYVAGQHHKSTKECYDELHAAGAYIANLEALVRELADALDEKTIAIADSMGIYGSTGSSLSARARALLKGEGEG